MKGPVLRLLCAVCEAPVRQTRARKGFDGFGLQVRCSGEPEHETTILLTSAQFAERRARRVARLRAKLTAEPVKPVEDRAGEVPDQRRTTTLPRLLVPVSWWAPGVVRTRPRQRPRRGEG